MGVRPADGGAVVLGDADRAAALDEVRGWLRNGGDGDAVLVPLIETALAVGEAFLGAALIAREFRDVMPVSGVWAALPMLPVTAITAVEGVPADGAGFALSADGYAVDIGADGIGWVRVMVPGSAGRVAVEYQAGVAGDWASLPQPVRQGVVMLAAHLVRGADAGAAPPAAVTALWRPFRRMRLNAAVRA
ncbi:head-tail connector protein [Stakelama saccharophila]|uniref:PhiE125 gp8 family phage protein n=1 Tax=Stakelama saccharophila TaxID=3075605 RepID=A0ABZ0BA54_9SPHN|nr:hypothetical protein [Stakelama sp. W311]WNO53546.1 hypothetical protein RPR59_14065 [Stakelama sp. W311]